MSESDAVLGSARSQGDERDHQEDVDDSQRGPHAGAVCERYDARKERDREIPQGGEIIVVRFRLRRRPTTEVNESAR